MLGTRNYSSIRIALCCLLLCGGVSTTRCASDLTDSLEGRPCAKNDQCLPGYTCLADARICVAQKDANLEDVGVESGDNEWDSGLDSGVDTGTENGPANSEGGDTGQVDAGNDARPCGFKIDPPEKDCPDECEKCLNGVCIIDCNSEQECLKANIFCPEGFACQVSCTNKQACENATIFCPVIYNCNVSCSADQSCKSTKIKCGENGPCALTCESDTEACLGAELQCKSQACEASCSSDQDLPEVKNCRSSCTSQCGC